MCVFSQIMRLLDYILHEFELNSEQAGSFEQRCRYRFIALSYGLPQVYVRVIPLVLTVWPDSLILDSRAEDNGSPRPGGFLESDEEKI